MIKNTISCNRSVLLLLHNSSICSAVFEYSTSLLLQQYQSAIRAHKLGKDVNFEELPVPPGEIVLRFRFMNWRCHFQDGHSSVNQI